MKPPICAICHEDFFEKGGLIYFNETEDDKIVNQRRIALKEDGHPPNAFWFCEKHNAEAQKLKYLTKKEAFKVLNEIFQY